jgi:membrane-bound lytic murein transglycosylase B
MRSWLSVLLLFLAATVAAQPSTPAPAVPYAERAEVKRFIRDMVDRHGFVESELVTLFSRLYRVEPVLTAIVTPAEITRWTDYRPIFVNAKRIEAGLAFWKAHQRTLARAEKRYGVPAEVIVAIIGVETSYGRNPGRWRVVEALATLAFDYPPRAGFFRSELEHYLLLARDADVDVFSVRGSYAGAIGIPQFMPSSLRRYAVDFDRDGRIDLSRNNADAIGSVANYLKQHGWRSGQALQRKTGEAEAAQGERLIDLGSEKRVGLANFQAILRYNRSPLYAAAVADLSEALAAQRSGAQRGGK